MSVAFEVEKNDLFYFLKKKTLPNTKKKNINIKFYEVWQRIEKKIFFG